MVEIKIFKLLFVAVGLFAGTLLFSSSAHAATFIVDSTSDTSDAAAGNGVCDDGGGACTLRAAIEESNALAGTDTVNFSIAGAGPHTFTPATAYPSVSETIILDATTEPGASCGTLVPDLPSASNTPHTLLIEIDGSSIPAATGNGFTLSTGSIGSTIRGFNIHSVSNSGSTGYGIGANPGSSGGHLIECNYIGTNISGTAALPNDRTGILLTTQTGVTIRNNLSSGNTVGGILLSTTSTGNTISGNILGLDRTGTADVGNGVNGIGITSDSDSNIISNNLSSGNGGAGLDISTFGATPDSQTVTGNIFGLDITGTVPLGNTNGVVIRSNSNTIGGPSISDRNYISDNGTGVLDVSGDDNQIENNYIGTDVTGMFDLGNGAGVVILGDDNRIINNLVSGNDGVGIALGDPVFGSGTGNSNTVQGNLIGTDATGEGVIANDGAGLVIAFSSSNIIGGTADGEENIIVGSDIGLGLVGSTSVLADATSNIIQGNLIGATKGGQSGGAFSNESGVVLYGDATDNLIGGFGEDTWNSVVNNTDFGIVVIEDSTLGEVPSANSILGNIVYGNGSVDIDLAVDTDSDLIPDLLVGPTPNDVGDTDTGPNELINTPVITDLVSSAGGNIDITFDLDVDESATGYRVEFFASDSADTSGFGPGQRFVGSVNVDGDVAGEQVNFTAPSSLYGETVSFSATTTEIDASVDGFGSTSEFSAATVEVEIEGLAETGIDTYVFVAAGAILLAVVPVLYRATKISFKSI